MSNDIPPQMKIFEYSYPLISEWPAVVQMDFCSFSSVQKIGQMLKTTMLDYGKLNTTGQHFLYFING